MMNRWKLLVCGLAVGFLACPGHARGTIPSYDFDWAVIGDPGNPAFEGILLAGRGGVEYLYRMSRTEVKVSQWFEFVQAYAPYVGDEADSFGFTGFFINLIGPGGIPSSYQITPGAENLPTNMDWRMAARYVNWLHNDKQTTIEAFSTGAYDTSTFTQNRDGTYNDQPMHSPGAKFWIPTLDEWIKAVYYDPSLNGGAGGWWHQPASSDEPLMAGVPREGGQTNASLLGAPGFPVELLDAGSYPDVQSPWSLLDASGGVWEWTEEFGNLSHSNRFTKSSSFFSAVFLYQYEDSICSLNPGHVLSGISGGLRVASQVPAPAGLCPWDLNGNAVVNVLDLIELVMSFGPCEGCPADFDDDGFVGVLDLFALILNFGPCPGTECVWDVNGDGIVDQSDVAAVTSNLGPCEDPDNCPWDVNGDGVVDASDVQAVATHLGPCP